TLPGHQQHQAAAALGLPATDAARLRRARHRRQKPDLPLRKARVLHHRQGGRGPLHEDPDQCPRPPQAGGGAPGSQGFGGLSVASSGRAWWLAGLLVLAAAAHATAAGPDWTSNGGTPEGRPKGAPAFALPDLDGRSVALADLRGKVTLVFFWATW